MLKTLITISTLATAPLLANAQSDAIQEAIIVTGMRISADSISDNAMPNVTLRVPADFVLFEASFINTDLETEARRSDLKKAFQSVLQEDRDRDDIELNIGDAEESYPIESTTFDEIYSPYGQRSNFDLAMRVNVRKGDNYDNIRARAEAFIDSVPEFGRVQSYIGDEQYIGLRNPNRYRSDLIAAISKEVDDMGDAFKASEITVFGLDKKTVTQPTGALSLDVFIPYDLKIVSKRTYSD